MELRKWQRPEIRNWSPFDQLSNLREEINHLFQTPFADLGRSSRFLNAWAPTLDMYENKDAFTIRAEIPGVKKEDIDVSVQNGVLSISGERKGSERKEAENYRTERFFGRFTRSITLPAPVNADKVKASYKDGVLSIHLPKTEEAKPKQIEVNID